MPDVERAASAKPDGVKAPRLQQACARGAARAQDVRAPANISENPVRRGLPWVECLSTQVLRATQSTQRATRVLLKFTLSSGHAPTRTTQFTLSSKSALLTLL